MIHTTIIKRFFFILSAAIITTSCNQNADQKEITTDLVNNPASATVDSTSDELPVFEFASEIHDFGTISQGEKVSYSFRFKNSGKTDLIISSAKGSCGCTVPEYPKNPIAPGEEGKIDVVFDSDGKSGKQNKTITIVANTYPSTKVLTIAGEVIAPEAEN